MSASLAASESTPKAAVQTTGPSAAVMGTYARQNLVFERGEGAWLITPDGERYLDFGSGVAVNVLGHAHPLLVAALTEQAGKLWHTSNLYRVEGQERLAERLVAATFADKVFFCNSGAEACEAAIKAARRYHYVDGNPQRWRIITYTGAFHGRTLATIAAGGNPKYLEGFGPAVEGFDQVPFGDIDATEQAITPETAAIMIEPTQGEGGVNVASAEFLRALRALCDKHGLLLILDEVQSGVGRCGKLFAHEWAGITPDLMPIAKGIGGGFPLGALLATEEAAKGLVPGTHGSTFGGNPLATAVGYAVLGAVLEPGFIEAVQQKALRMKQALASIKDSHPDLVEEVRGQGLLTGIKVKVAPADVVKAALAEKLLVVGASDNVVRLLPPLNIADEEIAEAAQRLSRALDRLSAPAT
ncbi:Acetylornithine aminotransferase [Hyphomicrobium sp. 1Nfss2.1]